MIVVADTSPLNYLVPLEQWKCSARPTGSKCGQTRLPTQHWSYLIQGKGLPCHWLSFLQADEVLIDERDGRAEAERRHLHITA